MAFGQKLVLRGVFLGSLLVSLFGYLLTSVASAPLLAEPVSSPFTDSAPRNKEVENMPEIDTDNTQANREVNPGDCQISGKYPPKVLRWCDLITTYAFKYDLPTDLVAAVILQESGGDPMAYSSSGAVGLMQVMPRDGLAANFMCANGPCFANRPSIKQLTDPGFNIKYGTRMLANLIKKNGNLREALKAYGPENVGYYYADKVLNIYKRYRQK